MMLAAGNKLGPHEFVGPLGAGGMADMYRLPDRRLDIAPRFVNCKSRYSYALPGHVRFARLDTALVSQIKKDDWSA
jgi:hypothetical protein